jgi:hypothetical protein
MQEQVLNLLQSRDRSPSELQDALKCEYPQLFTVLKDLQVSEKIEYYFTPAPSGVSIFPWEKDPHPILTYKIKNAQNEGLNAP